MKLRYRMAIHEVVRTVIVERVAGTDAVARIRDLIDFKQVPREDRGELSNLIETEISNLHEGNAVRVKVRPSEYQARLLAQTPANAAAPQIKGVSIPHLGVTIEPVHSNDQPRLRDTDLC